MGDVILNTQVPAQIVALTEAAKTAIDEAVALVPEALAGTPEDRVRAFEVVSQARSRFGKAIDSVRKPINALLKRMKALTSPHEDRVEQAYCQLKAAIAADQDAEAAKIAEQERAQLAALELARSSTGPAVVVLPDVEASSRRVVAVRHIDDIEFDAEFDAEAAPSVVMGADGTRHVIKTIDRVALRRAVLEHGAVVPGVRVVAKRSLARVGGRREYREG